MRLDGPRSIRAYLFMSIVCGGAPLVCAAGACAAAWWHRASVLQDLDTQIAANERRIRELEAVKPQIEALQAKRRELEKEFYSIKRLWMEKTVACPVAKPAGSAGAKKP